MLDHIHIENFRLFKELDIPKVGQVNLITGKNNVGKTTLLEGLRLWANANNNLFFGGPLVMMLLRERGDINGDVMTSINSLFHTVKKVEIIKNHNNLIAVLKINKITVKLTPENLIFQNAIGESLDWNLGVINERAAPDISNFVSSRFELQNARLWQNIELTDKEDKVSEILRIIEPKIVRVSIDTAENSAKVRLSNSTKPVPLKNYGEGLNRLLTIALGLVSSENNMLLIDEVDIGLHHSVQHLLWQIVFQNAKDLNVQVFATTHSSDCVEAFSDIANKPEYVGMGNYIRLQRSKKDGNIMAVDYEMEQLGNALDLNSETR